MDYKLILHIHKTDEPGDPSPSVQVLNMTSWYNHRKERVEEALGADRLLDHDEDIVWITVEEE